jgi:hypothetical protein
VLTVTANNASTFLDAPLPVFAASFSGFKNSETLATSGVTGASSLTTTATATSPVGNYPIVAALGTLTATNYTFGFTNGALTITYEPPGVFGGHQIRPPISLSGSSVFKQGSTVPAKFAVFDANGVSIGTPGVVSSFQLVQIINGTVVDYVTDAVDSTTSDSSFRWDTTSQQWIFNISTTALTANTTYVYWITLNDGTTIQFQFGLK